MILFGRRVPLSLALAGAALLAALLVIPWAVQAQSDPAAPSNLTAEVLDDGISLSWDAPTEQADAVTGYQVLRRRPAQGENSLLTLVEDTGSTATSYTDGTAAEVGVRYVYRVKARRGSELSARSNYVNVQRPEEEDPAPTPKPTPTPTPAPAVPAKPTGLTATSVSHASVTLSWDDPGDASITHYQVLRRDRDADDPGVFDAIEDDTGSAATSYTDEKAKPAKRYVYRVVAVNGQGASPRSGYVNVETPDAPDMPAAPTGLSASSVTHDSVTLSWDDPSDDSITGYQVLRRSRDGDEYGDGQGAAELVAVVDDTGSAATSYTDTPGTARTRYVYRVRARNSEGLGEQSGHLDVETPAYVPATPTGLLVESYAHDSVTLAWDDPQDDRITGYEVIRRDWVNSGIVTFTTTRQAGGPAVTGYTDASVEEGGRYLYRIKAVSASGESGESHYKQIRVPLAPVTPPAAPTGLSAPAVGHDTVTLVWDDPEDDSITGYRVLRRDVARQPGGTFTTIVENTGIATTMYADTSVGPERRYNYRIQAINELGESEETRSVRVTTKAAPSLVPAAPTGLSAPSLSHDSVTLVWDVPADSSITGYRVLRRDKAAQPAGVFTTVEDDTGVVMGTYRDISVRPQRRYVYRVRAINEWGVSEQSESVSIETPALPPPAAPTGFAPASVTRGSVTLTWDSAGDPSVTGYQVLRRSRDVDQYGDGQGAAEFAVVVDATVSVASTYIDMTVTARTRYVYAVKFRNAAGLSESSSHLRVETPAAKGARRGVGPRQNPDDCGGDTDTLCTATIGTPKSGNIETGGDMDVFKVKLAVRQMYVITVDGGSGQGKLGNSARITVFDSGNYYLTDPETSVEVLTEWWWDRVGGAGEIDRREGSPTRYQTVITFYVRVSSTSSSATGTYTLKVEPKADDCRTDTEDTSAQPACEFTADDIPDSGGVERLWNFTGAIETSGEIDWIKTPRLLLEKNYAILVFPIGDAGLRLLDPALLGIYTGGGDLIPFTTNHDQGWRNYAPDYSEYFDEEFNFNGRPRPWKRGEPIGSAVYAGMHFKPSNDGHRFIAVGGDVAHTGYYRVIIYEYTATRLYAGLNRQVTLLSKPELGDYTPSGRLIRGDFPGGEDAEHLRSDDEFSEAGGTPLQPRETSRYDPVSNVFIVGYLAEGSIDHHPVLGDFTAENDRDWFRVQLTADQRYEITVRPVRLYPEGKEYNNAVVHKGVVDVKLLGVVGPGLRVMPGTAGNNELPRLGDRVYFTPSESGVYHVVVGAVRRYVTFDESKLPREVRKGDEYADYLASLHQGHYWMEVIPLN